MSVVDPQVKGLQLLGMVKTLRARRKEALAALRPDLHHYLDDRIVVSSWYPEEHHLELLRATGKVVAALVPGDPWRFIGEQGAKADLSGLYANILRQGDPAASLQRMGQAWKLYHNTGEIIITLTTPKSVRVELVGFRWLAPEAALVNAGYLSGIARAAGAHSPSSEVSPQSTPEHTIWTVSWR